MTIQMADSVTPGNMPMGFPAYLGYVDGLFKTAPRLAELFPGAKVVALTVLGSTLSADGIDCEPGNVSARRAAVWVHDKLAAEPGFRPVVYADLESPGFSMTEVLAELSALGVTREQVRILTAHYDGEHVCSPARGCKDKVGNVITFTADGTQWMDKFPGIGGAAIDMSALNDDFFGSTQVDPTQEILMQLPMIKQGAAGEPVKTVQGLCAARGHAVTVDGVFGPATTAAVEHVQAAGRVTADGIVGPQTWRVLLGVLGALAAVVGVPGRLLRAGRRGVRLGARLRAPGAGRLGAAVRAAAGVEAEAPSGCPRVPRAVAGRRVPVDYWAAAARTVTGTREPRRRAVSGRPA